MLHTLQIVDEEAYVIRVKENALLVLVPKYGIEGTLFLSARPGSGSASSESQSVVDYDEEQQAVTVRTEGVCVCVFCFLGGFVRVGKWVW